MFLEFAVETQPMTEARGGELREEGWNALGEAAAAQGELQAGEEPTQQFIELLTAALVSGEAHIADATTDDLPPNAERWGWRPNVDGDLLPRGKRIGWLEPDGSLLLEPGAAFAATQRMASAQGTGLPIGKRTLWKRLAEKGLLASRDAARDRNTSRKTIGGERKNVVHLIPGALSINGPNGPNDPPPDKKGGLGPKEGAVSSPTQPETARKNGPEHAENGSSGPEGPLGPFSGGGSANGAERSALRCSLEVEKHLIDTEAELQTLLPELQEADRVALDLETTGLDPRQHQVRLLTLATECGTWLVDCFKVDPRPLFSILAEKKLLIHNTLFDLSFLREMGFEMSEGGEVIDTMLTSQLLEGENQEEEETE